MGKTAQEQRRMDHLRMLAGIFDSPRMRKIQEKAREEKGDCWDCRRALKVGHISTGRGVRMVVISCRATNNGAPVVRRLPFHCWYWEKKEKLQVLEGGGENGRAGEVAGGGCKDEAGASAGDGVGERLPDVADSRG